MFKGKKSHLGCSDDHHQDVGWKNWERQWRSSREIDQENRTSNPKFVNKKNQSPLNFEYNQVQIRFIPYWWEQVEHELIAEKINPNDLAHEFTLFAQFTLSDLWRINDEVSMINRTREREREGYIWELGHRFVYLINKVRKRVIFFWDMLWCGSLYCHSMTTSGTIR